MDVNMLLMLMQMQQSKAAWQIGNTDSQGFQSNTDSLMFALLLQSLLKESSAQDSGQQDSSSKTGTSSSQGMGNISSNGDYKGLIYSMGQKYGIDPQLLYEVIEAESNFDPNAVSSAGAQGLMQLMPGTAAAYGVTNAFDPVQNIAGGAQFLKDLLNRFDGNVSLALAGYNAGPGAVEKYKGIPPYAETQNYVKKIMSQLNGINIQI